MRMIKKYTYGNPFFTESVVVSFEASEGMPEVGTVNLDDGFSFLYDMKAEDAVYGLGEANRGINKRGYKYISNNTDIPNHHEDVYSLYASHNFVIISGERTFGLYIDYPSSLVFDIGYTKMDELHIFCDKADLDFYVITGESIYDIVKQFRQMIGKSYIAPKFAFGFGQSRWGYKTPEDFAYMINYLHRNGIGVILDWVPSNFPTDDFGLARFDGSPLYESNDPKTSKRDSWGTCLFNYARFEVTSFLVSCAMFWLDKYHIDGLRIGALSSMLYLDYGKSEGEWEPNKFGGKENLDAVDFVKRLNTAVHMYHPDVMMFAEENTSWPKLTHKIEDGGLGFDFKWNMGWMNDMLHYMSLNSMWRPFNHDSLTFSFYYAFSEKFLLPISHDEVSHGKGSLIKQMPGKYDEQFAGVRAFITYMYAHPGKKLVFMGTEIGQFDEWNHEEAIQWDLLEFEKHKKLRTFFKELNKFYLDCKPLYELDTVWKGFDWIHHDDYTNSVIAFKRTDKNGDEIVSVCNFQPIRRDEYCIGVPKYGLYDEVFNSDEERFGGSGVVNGNNIKTEVMKIHGFDQGLSLTLPPLSVIYLRCAKELEPDEAQKEN